MRKVAAQEISSKDELRKFYSNVFNASLLIPFGIIQTLLIPK